MSWGVKKTFLKEHSFLLMLKFELTRRFRLTKLLQECWLGTPLTAPLQLHTVSCLHPRRCTHHRQGHRYLHATVEQPQTRRLSTQHSMLQHIKA